MYFGCWSDWKKNTPNPKKTQKSPIFKRKNLEKSKVKFFLFFLIEAEFITQAEHNSQNMPKYLVFLQHTEERDRPKSHSFSPPLDFIDS